MGSFHRNAAQEPNLIRLEELDWASQEACHCQVTTLNANVERKVGLGAGIEWRRRPPMSILNATAGFQYRMPKTPTNITPNSNANASVGRQRRVLVPSANPERQLLTTMLHGRQCIRNPSSRLETLCHPMS